MNPTIPARVQARSHADRRLQSLTLGAVALGIAATGAFGYAAALTYTGKTTTANAANPQGGFGDRQYVPNGDNGASGTVNQNSAGGNVAPNVNNQQLVAPPIITQHRQHAVTGGS